MSHDGPGPNHHTWLVGPGWCLEQWCTGLPRSGVGHPVGTIDLAAPELRTGRYYPSWLLEPRHRAEQALVAVIADCYLAGVSTRRVDKLVKQIGIDGISKSQVSELAGAAGASMEPDSALMFARKPMHVPPVDGAPGMVAPRRWHGHFHAPVSIEARGPRPPR